MTTASDDGGNVPSQVPVSIQDELRTSYLDYAMSVIIGRAIPDVRDGLKPVHRRILYSMHEQGITAQSAYKKCARVVGDVLGKYHPHGDVAVYDALVRMAQDFSLRVPLVDGQGNFGSIDGDAPAAMRYTECRLAPVTAELLGDLDKDTVDFAPNYDESEREPSVLPARFPQLLVNGAGGIAVGMATNIPPHNLGEVIDATIALIEQPELPIAKLIEHMPGPDFPTGGQIYGTTGIQQAYATGRGSIVMRARLHVEPVQGAEGREQIVVDEVPYQVNKARLCARISELVKDKRLEGIHEVRDESDRDGIRVVVELKKDAFAQVVQNQLFRLTPLQTAFGVINLAICDGKPRVLDLKETLQRFIEHRREVVRRRSRFELKKAEDQREIVLGLGMATTDIDRVIEAIKKSADPDAARAALLQLPLRGLADFLRRARASDDEIRSAEQKGDFFLNERQAKAILEMRLSRLTGLERDKLCADHKELSARIAELSEILGDEHKLLAVIVAELRAVKEKYGTPRKTEIVPGEADIQIEDLIQQEDMAVAISHAGYIKRTAVSTYRAQKRGGKGRAGMAQKGEDWVKELFVASTHSYVFFFSDKGKLYVKKVYEIPEAAANARGRAIVNFIGLEEGERIAAITPVDDFEAGKFIVTLTRRGQIKKTDVAEYRNYRETGLIGVKIDEGDELFSAAVTDGQSEILIGTKAGMAIRFSEQEVRPMGRATMGVKGVELEEGDAVVAMALHQPGSERDRVLTICELGHGKQTPLCEFRAQEEMAVAISHAGTIKRTPLSAYRAQKRGSKGRAGMVASEEDWVKELFVAQMHSYVFFFGDKGKVFVKKVHEIPEAAAGAPGRAIASFVGLEEGERLAAITPVAAFAAGKFIVTLTKNGLIKKTELTEYENYRQAGLIGVKIDEGDALHSAAVTDGKSEILIGTKAGMAIRFSEEEVRPTGRATMGVKGVELEESDAVVGMGVYQPGGERDRVLTVCELGYGKQTPLEEFRLQGRGGKGVIMIDASERNGPVVGLALVRSTDQLLLVTDRGQTLRTGVGEIRETGRNAQGVSLMKVGDGERIVAVETFAEGEEEAVPPAPPSAPALEGRGGKGVVMIDVSDKSGPVVGVALVQPSDQLLLITDRGQTLRTAVAEIPETGRVAPGVPIMKVGDGERVVAIETFAEDAMGGESQAAGESAMPAPTIPPGSSYGDGN